MEREYSSASAFKTLSFAVSSCRRTVSRSQTSLVLLARPGANLFKKANHESSRTAPLGDHTEGTLDFLQPLTPPCHLASVRGYPFITLYDECFVRVVTSIAASSDDAGGN